MKLNLKDIRQKILFMYAGYQAETDDPASGIDWLENVADGICTIDQGDDYFILFRGTDPNKASGEINYKIGHHRLPYPGVNPKIWVHTGFIDAYDVPACRDVLEAKVIAQLVKNPATKFWIIGHSQGAALAQLCALDMHYKFGNDLNLVCVAVASPMLGNSAFVKSFQSRVQNSYMIRRGIDIVELVPFWLLGFRQPSTVIHYHVRNIFSIVWNFFSGLAKMIWFKRTPIYEKYFDYFKKKTGASLGSDWYIFEDHSPFYIPQIDFETDSVKQWKNNKIKI